MDDLDAALERVRAAIVEAAVTVDIVDVGGGFPSSYPGMEPPPEARLVDGWFQWRPARAPMPEVVLGNSDAAGEWRLCHDGNCRNIVGHIRVSGWK